MSQVAKKGPPPIEDAAVNYAVDLYNHLRCGNGWRANTSMLLLREYRRFVRDAISCEFGVLSLWEYAQLVQATHQYLRSSDNLRLSTQFHKRVCKDIGVIANELKNVTFSDQEKESMRTPCERIESLLEIWEMINGARE